MRRNGHIRSSYSDGVQPREDEILDAYSRFESTKPGFLRATQILSSIREVVSIE